MSPALIIFDCDGVLVDTERRANLITQKTLASYGWQLSMSEVLERFMGRSVADNLAVIQNELGTSADDYLSRWDEMAGNWLNEVEAVEGVHDV